MRKLVRRKKQFRGTEDQPEGPKIVIHDGATVEDRQTHQTLQTFFFRGIYYILFGSPVRLPGSIRQDFDFDSCDAFSIFELFGSFLELRIDLSWLRPVSGDGMSRDL